MHTDTIAQLSSLSFNANPQTTAMWECAWSFMYLSKQPVGSDASSLHMLVQEVGAGKGGFLSGWRLNIRLMELSRERDCLCVWKEPEQRLYSPNSPSSALSSAHSANHREVEREREKEGGSEIIKVLDILRTVCFSGLSLKTHQSESLCVFFSPLSFKTSYLHMTTPVWEYCGHLLDISNLLSTITNSYKTDIV